MGLVIIAGVIGYVTANYSRDSKETPEASVQPAAYQAIKYPDNWIEDQQISGQENHLHIISRASRKSPDATAFVRTEQIKMTKDFDINKTADQTAQALAGELKDFTLVSKKLIKLGSMDAIQIVYKQMSEQYMLVIIPRSDKVYYLTVKSQSTDFEKISGEAQDIISSLGGYITAHD